jgi:hypothetical protein
MTASSKTDPIPSPRASGERARERGLRLAVVLVLLTLLTLTSSAPAAHAAAPAASALTGRWMATATDGQVFAGTWSASFAVDTPNAAIGAWKLVDETGVKVLMRGTWSARKVQGAWRGSWAARVEGGGAASGQWTADAKTAAAAKTFRELLALTAETQIGGTWRTSHNHGNWWLKPLAP